MLLSNLQMPIESTFSVVKDPDGSVRYAHSLYREGPDQDQSYDANYFTFQQVLTTEDDRDNARRVVALRASNDRVAITAKRSEGKYSTQAEKTESLVRQANEEAEQRAAKIIPVLAATTGQSFETPKQWWDWYRDSNEYFMSEHPVNYQYYSDTDSRVYNGPEDRYASQHSCFGKGTPVWTKTGLKPIEALQQGDLVLSQNTETGELHFEPVLLRTLRPVGKMMKLTTDSCELNATTGHPFWVAGQGWKMTKELGDDAVLHCLKGADRVRSIASTDDAEAYNLVVAEYNTYFVGSSGLLVHDIRPRGPIATIEPGVASLSESHRSASK